MAKSGLRRLPLNLLRTMATSLKVISQKQAPEHRRGDALVTLAVAHPRASRIRSVLVPSPPSCSDTPPSHLPKRPRPAPRARRLRALRSGVGATTPIHGQRVPAGYRVIAASSILVGILIPTQKCQEFDLHKLAGCNLEKRGRRRQPTLTS